MDGSVGKSIRYGQIDVWRLKNKISFGSTQKRRLPNGLKVDDFVPEATYHCADFRISMRDLPDLSGPNRDDVAIVAIRHKPNRDLNYLLAKYKGKIYMVDLVMPDYSKLMGYDLVALRLKDSKGGKG